MIRNVFAVIAMCALVGQSRAALKFKHEEVKKSLAASFEQSLPYSFQWIVSLVNNKTGSPIFFCSGTLISGSFVITAAHCIHPKQMSLQLQPHDIVALLGANHNRKVPFDSADYQLSPKKIHIHDDWNPWSEDFDGDLALLEFEKGRIVFNERVQLVCLAENKFENKVKEGTISKRGQVHDVLVKSGEDFGKIFVEKPKLIPVLIQSEDRCLGKNKSSKMTDDQRTFCVGSSNGSEVCHGDSGGGLSILFAGPFFYRGIYQLKGVKSSSLYCEDSKKAIYTDVSQFNDWIKKIAGVPQSPSIPDVGKVYCNFEVCSPDICVVNQAIDNENFIMESGIDANVQELDISDNRNVKFLPRNVAKTLPKLKEYWTTGCGLTIVRNFNFKNLRKLELLYLSDNKIVSIESDSFKDLVNLKELSLSHNMIRTLDENIFAASVDLAFVFLQDNRLIFLSPATFKTSSGMLLEINLENNECIDEWFYHPNPKEHLDFQLLRDCTEREGPIPYEDVFCTFTSTSCAINQTIGHEYFILKSPLNRTVKQFDISNNRDVKFLPRRIGRKLPNLEIFLARRCGLTVVRDHFFKGMRDLQVLNLRDNKITSIEANAFEDLIEVYLLSLGNNMIETLDKNLFETMSSLEQIYLNDNKIKFLSFETFEIPETKLVWVSLKGNVCIDRNYYSGNWHQLKDDLNNCTEII